VIRYRIRLNVVWRCPLLLYAQSNVDRQKLNDAGDGDEFIRNFENACDVLNKLAEKEQTLALRSN
jgi:hypothetical protein